MSMPLAFIKFTENDFLDYFRLVSDIRVMAQITERAIPEAEARADYERLLAENSRHEDFGSFRVVDTDSGDYIGLARISLNETNPGEAEIGYMLLPEYWDRGYGRKTVAQLLEVAEKTGLEHLTALIDPENGASKKLLTNNHFYSTFVGMQDGLMSEFLRKDLK
ncbi:GNAT family N-acetyltransferase [Synergistaceae bacterium OttesenSCG-928-D05]|nr:GNAT family N-acetyltransferase [Synergistaceae bacterium OttesenSCG-928-D05]